MIPTKLIHTSGSLAVPSVCSSRSKGIWCPPSIVWTNLACFFGFREEPMLGITAPSLRSSCFTGFGKSRERNESLGVALPLGCFITVCDYVPVLYFTRLALLLCLLVSVSVCRVCGQGCGQRREGRGSASSPPQDVWTKRKRGTSVLV